MVFMVAGSLVMVLPELPIKIQNLEMNYLPFVAFRWLLLYLYRDHELTLSQLDQSSPYSDMKTLCLAAISSSLTKEAESKLSPFSLILPVTYKAILHRTPLPLPTQKVQHYQMFHYTPEKKFHQRHLIHCCCFWRQKPHNTMYPMKQSFFIMFINYYF